MAEESSQWTVSVCVYACLSLCVCVGCVWFCTCVCVCVLASEFASGCLFACVRVSVIIQSISSRMFLTAVFALLSLSCPNASFLVS